MNLSDTNVDLNSMTDEELCRLAAESREAEEYLILRYSRTVRAIARPLYLAGGDSEDLIQEGLFGLIKAVRDFDPGRQASFKTYAQICIRHRLYSAVKSAGRGKHVPLNDSVPFQAASFDSDSGKANIQFHRQHQDPEELIIGREEVGELLSALNGRLSSFESQVLKLFLDGLSYSEIAAIVGKPQKSVDNAVQRIKRKFAQQINKADTA